MAEKFMTENKPIVALGELLVDLIPGKEGMLIEDAGPVIKTASGSAGIFACAVSLLGGNGAFIGKLGRDKLSQMVLKTLQAQGVDTGGISYSEEGQLGLAFLEYTAEGRNYQYYRKNSVGSRLKPEDLDEKYIASAWGVHFPGMLLELNETMRESCYQLIKLAKKNNVYLSFDPNIRTELTENAEALDRLRYVVSQADIVSPTLEEAQILTQCSEIKDVIRELHNMGPEVVAITRDKDGAVISKGGSVAVAEGINEKAIDPTGAGDTFAAALCVGLKEQFPLDKLALFVRVP